MHNNVIRLSFIDFKLDNLIIECVALLENGVGVEFL